MHALVIAQYFPPDMGGGSTRAFNVVKGLLSKGCKVTLIAAFPHYPQGKVPLEYKDKPIVPEQVQGLKVFRVWVPSLPSTNIVNRILLHICFVITSLFAFPFISGFDVIWAANPNLFCFYSAIVYGFLRRKPVVRNVDDLWPEVFYELGLVRSKLMQTFLDFLAWISYASAAAITPLSLGYKLNIVDKYRICADKIQVIEVGVDSVKPLIASGNSNERFVVMYSGILGFGYDFDIVLDTARLLAENKDVLFVIRGVGELAPKLRRKISILGLQNVILDTRFLPKDELAELLGSADVFVLPMASVSFVEEGLPTKVFEYQAYGKPIVCVSSGEPARYVESTESGVVVKPGDCEALAKAILRLREDRDFAKRLGASGRRYVENNLSTEKIGFKMVAVLNHVLRDSSRIRKAEPHLA